MTSCNPVLCRNVKLVSMFSPKPGENSENVAKMVRCFDTAVNRVLPFIATKYNIDPEMVSNWGLDAASYVGDVFGPVLVKLKGIWLKTAQYRTHFT